MTILHEIWSHSLKQINKGMIEVFVTLMCKGIANKHWL
jgi:hypothetical protein